MKQITRADLELKLRSNAKVTLLEALPERYYRDGHLPGALNMPHDQVDTVAVRTLSDKDAELIVYCASVTCKNSDVAARRLELLGYTNVSVYAGGKREWEDAGLPVERREERSMPRGA